MDDLRNDISKSCFIAFSFVIYYVIFMGALGFFWRWIWDDYFFVSARRDTLDSLEIFFGPD